MTENQHPSILITAGPTHEPIDAVRYLGNRSSGTLGVALADHAASKNYTTTLLLGPTHKRPTNTHVNLQRFRTTNDLQQLLQQHAPNHQIIIMAAAVADYRATSPDAPANPSTTKLRRTKTTLTLQLQPTPDLLAAITANRKPGQTFVGFALEPQSRLHEAAAAKLARKRVDMIVANPLETMEAPNITATIFTPDRPPRPAPPDLPKPQFAAWLLDHIEATIRTTQPTTQPTPQTTPQPTNDPTTTTQ